jgi:hypothetical protein
MVTFLLQFFYVCLDKHQTLHNFWGGIEIMIIIKDRQGTMKNAVFWYTKIQFVPHSKHITSPLQSSAG